MILMIIIFNNFKIGMKMGIEKEFSIIKFNIENCTDNSFTISLYVEKYTGECAEYNAIFCFDTEKKNVF